MGARQSKRSVDISGPPKKGELDNGGVEEGGKLERLEESDVVAKTTQNGTTPHTTSTPVTEEAQPVLNGDSVVPETTPEKKEETEETKSEEKDESLVNGAPESPEGKDKSSDDAAATPDKDKKKKEKSKKKWSFRSISFSRKDKSKPNLSKDEGKNGSITKEPVVEAVEAEAAAATEAIPVKDDEAKKEEPTERPEEEDEKKKEEKAEASTAVQSLETSPASPAETLAPTPVEAPAAPAPASPVPAPAVEPVVAPVSPPTPEPVAEPVIETITAPVVEAIQETVAEKPQEVPVVEEPVVETKIEVKVEELPPPLPASPPPTEAPPPTPVATTPAPASQIPDVSLHAEADTQDNEVVGGGGESMAEPEDVEPVLDTDDKLDDAPLVNGISDHTHQFVEEISEKVEIVSDNFKTIVTDSIISTQVTVTENSEEKLEQTASAAE